MMKKWIIFLSILSILTLTGCSAKGDSGASENKVLAPGESTYLKNGDLQEATASIDKLPAFLDGKDEQMRKIYQLAAANSDLLQWIPCYCGCANSANHQHNGNCFYKEIRADGTIVWDDHGTRCNTCMEIAAYSVQKKSEGMSTLEIRNWIDDHYKEGYAKPTPTPMPQG